MRALHLDRKGRGRALRAAWSASDARSSRTWTSTCPPTSMPCCPSSPRWCRATATSPSARGWLAGCSGRARPAPRAHLPQPTTCSSRPPLRTGFSDAQCGFKALRTDVARTLLPQVEDQGWFFDTELLVLAERNGPAHPRGPRRLGRRPRLAGRRGAHRARRPAPACGACCRRRPTGPASAASPDCSPDRPARCSPREHGRPPRSVVTGITSPAELALRHPRPRSPRRRPGPGRGTVHRPRPPAPRAQPRSAPRVQPGPAPRPQLGPVSGRP